MTLTEIKAQLGIARFQLNPSTDADGNIKTYVDEDGVETTWLRHWDNDTRTSVSIPKELAEELAKKGNSIDSLALQEESRDGAKGTYLSYRIVKYKPAFLTL